MRTTRRRHLVTAVAVVAYLATALGPVGPAAGVDGERAGQPAASRSAASQPSPPATPPAIDPALLIVMDRSSSMDTQDASGGSRIDGAKTAVTDFIATLPSSARVGLNTYPSASGCDAGTEAIPVGTASLQDMDAYVRTLDTGGDTPTGLALQKAGQDLQAAGGQTGVIILVSDGESNCEGTSPPPCEVAEQLAASGLDVTVNTVGFQISDVGREELQCIADATGGAYVDVTSGEELADEITDYSLPELSISLDPKDQTVSLEPGTSNDVVIAATVTNTGAIVAPNVEATITYDATFSPGSAKPRHRLGNLGPGEASSFTWRFRPTDEFSDKTVRFSALASTRGFQTAPVAGSVTFRRSTSTKGLPTWLRDAKAIVVMGDSYSSGEGAGTADPDEGVAFDEPTDEPYNSCHRSKRYTTAGALARLLDDRPKVHVLACSGATTLAMWSRADDVDAKRFNTVDGTKHGDPLPSQIQQLEDLDVAPDLVMLTIGGNDAGFQSIVTTCLIWLYCDPVFPWMKTSAEILQQGLRSLPAHLQTTYRSIAHVAEDKAGHQVPILVSAYPIPFPIDGSQPCVPQGQLFDPWTRQFLNSTAIAVNSLVRQEVDKARAQGVPVWFVERTAGAFQAGHTFCDRDAWINRITAEGLVSMGADAYAGASNDYSIKDYLQITKVLASRSIGDHAALLAYKNMLHPSRRGYEAQAVQIVTWSTRHTDLRVAAPKTTDDDRGRTPPVEAVAATVRAEGSIDLDGTGRRTVAPGSVWLATGTGFAPGTEVTFSVRSEPEVAAGVTAGDDGSVSAGIWFRPDLPLGGHHLVATGTGADGQPRTLTVGVTVERPLPRWWWAGVGLAVAAALGSVACAAVWRRRRSRPLPDGQ